jgi:hypothetical protein
MLLGARQHLLHLGKMFKQRLHRFFGHAFGADMADVA